MPSKTNTKTEPTQQAIGIAFDHSLMVAALISAAGRILAERRAAMPQRTTRAAAAELAHLVLELAAAPERGEGHIAAIGLAVSGVVDPGTARVSLAELKGWNRVALLPMVEAALNDSGQDIRRPAQQRRARAALSVSAHPAMSINTRLAALAAGEAWTGAAAGKQNVIYVSVSETIAAGILIDGRTLRGANGGAGGIGWMTIGEPLDGYHHRHGAFNAEAGSNSLARRAIDGWSGFTDSIIGGTIKTDPGALDPAMLIRAARGGDPLAGRIVGETCRALGRGLANLISIFDPDAIVLGGALGAQLKPYLEEIRAEARRWAAPEAGKRCRIVSAALGERGALIGAARLASPAGG